LSNYSDIAQSGCQTSCLKYKEESPYKPDTVKNAFFKRENLFARWFCPFLFVTI